MVSVDKFKSALAKELGIDEEKIIINTVQQSPVNSNNIKDADNYAVSGIGSISIKEGSHFKKITFSALILKDDVNNFVKEEIEAEK